MSSNRVGNQPVTYWAAFFFAGVTWLLIIMNDFYTKVHFEDLSEKVDKVCAPAQK